MVYDWKNAVPRYSSARSNDSYRRCSSAIDSCATNGEPWPTVKASATDFFSVSLPCVAAPIWFMSKPPVSTDESEFWPPVFE